MYGRLIEEVRAGRAVAMATVTASHAEGPAVGSKLLALEDGGVAGSIHPDADALLLEEARRLLREEGTSIFQVEAGGAAVEVFVESFAPPPHLVIVGAVHVAIPLCSMAKLLGYEVTVVDPRAAFATPERFPEADRIMVEWPQDALPRLPMGRSAAVVVLSHDAKVDVPALLYAAGSGAGYVGAIGSRGTARERAEELARLGATEEQIARIHSPVGLRIGSRTPAEIALSIMAEIVAERRGTRET